MSPRARGIAELSGLRRTIHAMRYEVRFREWDHRDAFFDIRFRGEYFRVVKVVFSRSLMYLVGRSVGAGDPHSPLDIPEFQRGIYRLATRLIENALKAGAIETARNSELYIIELTEDDETVGLLTELARGDKVCSYQQVDSGNLFCTAATAADETALPIVLDNGRRVAPTSRPLCAACKLPDTDYICSHFLHPQVLGTKAIGGPGSSISRDLVDGLCDLNQPEFANMHECHAGGNACWERIVEVETAPVVEAVPPQAVEQALDDLDVRWRLAFGNRHIVRLPGAADVSILALPCGSRDEFERRLSVLADIMKRLDIPDNMFPAGTDLPDVTLTHRRLEILFESKLADDELDQVKQAVSALRSINQLRVGGQHGGDALKKRARAADELGVPLDGRWGDAWERVRALAAGALRDIGDAARPVADTS